MIALLLIIACTLVHRITPSRVFSDGMNNELAVLSFDQQLENTLIKAKTFLQREKSQEVVVASENVRHQYEDKYLLTEQMSRSALNALTTSLLVLGVSEDKLKQVHALSSKSTILLRFNVEERCAFVKEEEKEVDTGVKHVEEVSVGLFSTTVTKKSVHTYTEYIYNVHVNHKFEIVIRHGPASTEVVPIWNHDRKVPYSTRQKQPPLPEVSNSDELDITWLVTLLSYQADATSLPGKFTAPHFRIQREADETWTPIRNQAVQKLLTDTNTMVHWLHGVCFQVQRWFDISMQQWSTHRRIEWNRISQAHKKVFVPVTAFFQQINAIADNHTVVSMDMIHAFQLESAKNLVDVVNDVKSLFATPAGAASSSNHKAATLITDTEAKLVVVLHHMTAVIDVLTSSLDYVESIMRKQLTQALGKEIYAADISEYMSYHYRRLYQARYQPVPWTVSVRRSLAHSPEGGLRLETEQQQGKYKPIETFTRSFSVPATAAGAAAVSSAAHTTNSTAAAAADSSGPLAMSFPINAATRVSFAGERHVHAWLVPTFDGDAFASPAQSLRLVTTAQQFSSYILLLGRVSSATTFEPAHAFIIQNKEEVMIPLFLETIPNAKQFRDAIESLSLKQQRFARAFRAMQLESTLFGVVILQIKPQLERVLNLAPDSLTKEIALTRDLMELFIEYQIPADLLSADNNVDAESSVSRDADEANAKKDVASSSSSSSSSGTTTTKVSSAQLGVKAVKEHVQQMKVMLNELKDNEVKERERQQRFDHPIPVSQPSAASSASSHSTQQFTEQVGGLASHSTAMRSKAAMMQRHQSDISIRSGSSVSAMEGVSSSFAAAAQSSPIAASVNVMDGSTSSSSSSSSTAGDSANNVLHHAEASSKNQQKTTTNDIVDNADTAAAAARSSLVDFNALPQRLDDAFDRMDSSHATRPAIIRIQETWTRTTKKSLLSAIRTEHLQTTQLDKEKNAAFELLDALTRSGSLVIEHAALHVITATTHSFTDSVLETIIQQNRNPIEDLERSSLVLVSTMHEIDTTKPQQQQQVLQASHVARILASGAGGRSYESKDVKALLSSGASESASERATEATIN